MPGSTGNSRNIVVQHEISKSPIENRLSVMPFRRRRLEIVKAEVGRATAKILEHRTVGGNPALQLLVRHGLGKDQTRTRKNT